MESVAVVMAVYNPCADWLRAQLNSIDAQEYPDIEVIAIDDASDKISHYEIAEIFASSLRRFPYRLYRNETNVGSDMTFELLTGKATSKYIAYCDQDDIWEPQKTGALVGALKPGVSLAYSDLSVIDADGIHISDSLRKIRRRLSYSEGRGLSKTLLFRNFISGTAMMTRTETAQRAVPFVKDMSADHWIALFCSTEGRIALVPEPLVKYRIHGGNQTAVLAGVESRASYLERRILPGISRFKQFEKRLAHIAELEEFILNGQSWFEARKNWFLYGKDAPVIRKLRHLSREAAMFELLTARLPEPLFIGAVRLVKRVLL